MTTTAKTTAAGTILALDLGNYKSVACLYDRGAGFSLVFSHGKRGRRDLLLLLSPCPWA